MEAYSAEPAAPGSWQALVSAKLISQGAEAVRTFWDFLPLTLL
jgi:hypothetical protein